MARDKPVSTFWGRPEERPWGFYVPVQVEWRGVVQTRDVAIKWPMLAAWEGVIPSGWTIAWVSERFVIPVGFPY